MIGFATICVSSWRELMSASVKSGQCNLKGRTHAEHVRSTFREKCTLLRALGAFLAFRCQIITAGSVLALLGTNATSLP